MADKKRRSPLSFIVGLIVLCLTAAGIVSIVSMVSQELIERKNEASLMQMKEYEKFVAPVIMYDPDTFDDITMANTEQLISIAIWSILDSDLPPDAYEYTDGGMIIPQTDVEEKFRKLFGNEAAITHSTVDGGGIYFSYSEDNSSYIIPLTGVTPIYTPKVTEIVERDSTVILTVGYLASTDWAQDSEGNIISPEPAKYMKITLGKNSDGSFYLRALQTAE